MAKGSLPFSCSGLAEMLRYRMESSGPNDRSEVKADSDLANELKLWDEWNVLVGQRSNWKENYDDVTNALLICKFDLMMGRYPPPWAIKALVETITDYLDMVVDLTGDDGKPVQPSQISRLENFLVDDVTPTEGGVKVLRADRRPYRLFCLFVQANMMSAECKMTYEGMVGDFLDQSGYDFDVKAFQVGLNDWAQRSADNKRRYDVMRSSIEQKKIHGRNSSA